MIFFFIRESLRLFFKAKLSSFLTFVSTSIAVVLIAVSFFLYHSSSQVEIYLKENITISVFLKDSALRNGVESMKQEIINSDFTSQIDYISKDDAVEIFIRETGEDFRKILDYNPLPASFNIRIKSEYAEADSLNNVINLLSSFIWVDEVIYKDDIIQKLLVWLKDFRLYVFAFTLLIVFVSLYLVYSTVKLILNSRTEEFETMKLVGAKLSTIKFPIIFHGLVIGFLASLSAAALFYLILFLSGDYISTLKVIQFKEYPYLVLISLTGPFISVSTTVFSLRKVSLKIKT